MFANLEAKTIAIGVALATVAAMLLFHFFEISHLHTKIATLTTANAKLAGLNAAYKSANETCATLSQQQNAQIDALKTLADERAASAAQARQVAHDAAQTQYNKASDIAKRAPSQATNVCASLNDLFNESLRGRK